MCYTFTWSVVFDFQHCATHAFAISVEIRLPRVVHRRCSSSWTNFATNPTASHRNVVVPAYCFAIPSRSSGA